MGREPVAHAFDFLLSGITGHVAADHLARCRKLHKLALHLCVRQVKGFGNFGIQLLAVGSKVLKNSGVHPAGPWILFVGEPRSVHVRSSRIKSGATTTAGLSFTSAPYPEPIDCCGNPLGRKKGLC